LGGGRLEWQSHKENADISRLLRVTIDILVEEGGRCSYACGKNKGGFELDSLDAILSGLSGAIQNHKPGAAAAPVAETPSFAPLEIRKLDVLVDKPTRISFSEKLYHHFIMGAGRFKLLEKAYSLPEVAPHVRKTRDKYIAHGIIRELLKEKGMWLKLVRKGAIIGLAPRHFWETPENRIKWTQDLATYLKKPSHLLSEADFNGNGLHTIIVASGSNIHKVLSEAFPDDKIMPWQTGRIRDGYFDVAENRIAAVRWLCETCLKKPPLTLTALDYIENGLFNLLKKNDFSLYKTIKEAYPDRISSPSEMLRKPQGFYKIRKNRLKILKEILAQTKRPQDYTEEEMRIVALHDTAKENMTKDEWRVYFSLKEPQDPRRLEARQFNNYGAGALFNYYGSVYACIADLLPELKIKPWEMKNTPSGYFMEKAHRISAVRWLCYKKLKTDPRELTRQKFEENGLLGLLTEYYNGSPYLAVKEAYSKEKIKPWEMRKVPQAFFTNDKNCAEAVRWLCEEKLKILPGQLQRQAIIQNGMGSALKFYNGDFVKLMAVAYPGLPSEKVLQGWAARYFNMANGKPNTM